MALALSAGCALFNPVTRVPLLEKGRANLGSTRALSTIVRAELGTSIVASRSGQVVTAPPAYPSVDAAPGGPGVAGVVGTALGNAVVGLIDDAVNASRFREAEAAIAPIRASLAGHDPGGQLVAALSSELRSVAWLPVDRVEGRPGLQEDALPQALHDAGTNTVLSVRADYWLDPGFDGLVVEADVALWPRATPDEYRERKVLPTYENKFKIVVPRPMVPYAPGVDKSEEAFRGRKARVWSDGGGAPIRRAVDGALAELARMIAFDLGDVPAAAWLEKGTAYDLVVVRKEGERSWRRQPPGALFSDGPAYPATP